MLPGLGADAKMYEPQRRRWPDLHVPAWIEPQRGESLASYAKRMAQTIDTTQPFFLGGCSMGGMVALEMARHIDPLAVFLIGSCRSGMAVSPVARRCASLRHVVPDIVVRMGVKTAWSLYQRLPMCRLVRNAICPDMSPTFIKWATGAIVSWRFDGELKAPVYHLHGGRDYVLLLRRVEPDCVVPDAMHMPNMTHADIVNAYLEEKMAMHLNAAG